MKSLVSVIIPTRNSEDTIRTCLRSVREQNYPNIGVIVVDACSSDRTREIAENFGAKIIVSKTGRSIARNIGARKAAGEWILFLDSDMELDSSVIDKCVKEIGKGSDAVIIPEVSVGEGFWTKCKALEKRCYIGDDLIEAARFFRRSVFENMGGYDAELEAGEDWDLNQRLSKAGYRIGRINAFIKHYEGRLGLRATMLKKHYYGKTLERYRKKHPTEAKHQLKLIRPAFTRNWRGLVKDPVHALGMLVMKACELGAVGLGLLATAGDNEPKKNIEHTSSYKQNSSSRRQRLKKKTTRKISPKVFVIVLNFNGMKYLKSCLPSLMSQTYSNYQVVVCDNASTDGSANYVKLNFPSAILIQNRENLGFSKGNNKALKLALDQGADYLQLFNNDTIAEKDVIESLVKTAESNEEIGIVGPKILDFKNRTLIQEMGMTCDKFGFPAAMKTRKESVFEAFYVSGCAMLIKQEVLRKIGGFDEKYFMFSEDLDLCWRTQLAGYTVVVNKAAKVYHASGGSIIGGAIKNGTYTTTLKRMYLRERNTLRTLTKNYSIANLIKIIPVYLVMLSLECFIWACLLKPGVSTSLLKGSWWNIKVLRDTLTQRQKIQMSRKIADKQIFRKIIKGYAKLQVLRLVGIPRVLES